MTTFNSKIIGISGGSGSGKTTFSRGLAKIFEALPGRFSEVGVLAQDSYYIDQSPIFKGDGENVNFDHPDSIDFNLLAEQIRLLRLGSPVEVPIYDFSTHQRKTQKTPFHPRSLIVIDGTLILSQPSIQKLLDWSIFIQTSEAVRFQRRFHRDLIERGRTAEGIRKQFDRQVKPMHDLFVEPSKVYATEVLSGEDRFDEHWRRWANQIDQSLK